MTAILLAAGRGTRISRMVKAVPKSTLPINGIPLIRHTVKMLNEKNIKCVVCTGYEREKVQTALEGLDVRFAVNPFYDVTNSIASLWLAKTYLSDDLIIMNADVYISNDILELILKDKNDVVMAIDKSRTETGDYFFGTDINGVIEKYGKDLPIDERTCEYVGLCKIEKSFCQTFTDRMDELILQYKHDMWWENILYSFTGERDIHTIDVGGLFWSEIDYFDDYERILNHIEKEKTIHNYNFLKTK